MVENIEPPLSETVEIPAGHGMAFELSASARATITLVEGPHRSCADNFREAISALGHEPPHVPSPVNLFENVAVGANGELEIVPPAARKGDAVTLKAERNLLLVLSSCPMDIAATNGADRRVKPVSVLIA